MINGTLCNVLSVTYYTIYRKPGNESIVIALGAVDQKKTLSRSPFVFPEYELITVFEISTVVRSYEQSRQRNPGNIELKARY